MLGWFKKAQKEDYSGTDEAAHHDHIDFSRDPYAVRQGMPDPMEGAELEAYW